MTARRVTVTPTPSEVIMEHGPRWQTLLDRFSTIESRVAVNEGRISAVEGIYTIASAA